jgi:hypothetical protein
MEAGEAVSAISERGSAIPERVVLDQVTKLAETKGYVVVKGGHIRGVDSGLEKTLAGQVASILVEQGTIANPNGITPDERPALQKLYALATVDYNVAIGIVAADRRNKPASPEGRVHRLVNAACDRLDYDANRWEAGINQTVSREIEATIFDVHDRVLRELGFLEASARGEDLPKEVIETMQAQVQTALAEKKVEAEANLDGYLPSRPR